MAESRDESFLARWSRRKQAAREARPEPAEAKTQAPAPEQGAVTPVGEVAAPQRAGAAPPQDLPDPATLDASADFSVFVGRNVPLATHRAALRRLWHLDPFYNRHDGLSDYCEDFTDQATVMRGLRTAYRVGRGLLERAAKADADAPAPTARAQPLGAEATPAPPEPPSSEPSEKGIAARSTRTRREPPID